MDHSGNTVDYRDKKSWRAGFQCRKNLATIQLIPALEAVIEESTQQKIGLGEPGGRLKKHTLNVRN